MLKYHINKMLYEYELKFLQSYYLSFSQKYLLQKIKLV